MKAMILAAGLGKRMRPLTNTTPKPLLKANNRFLIDYHLEKIADAGIRDIVINTHWLGEQIPAALGQNGNRDLSIRYSQEETLLETAGGILKALAQLTDGQSPFLVINGDVYSDLNLKDWLNNAPVLSESRQAYLALIPNPEHNPSGDFAFDQKSQQLYLAEDRPDFNTLTYSGIALFHPSFFAEQSGDRQQVSGNSQPTPLPLGPILKQKIQQDLVAGICITDYWLDVGTPERLSALNDHLAAN